MRSRRVLSWAAALCLLPALAGCGGGKAVKRVNEVAMTLPQSYTDDSSRITVMKSLSDLEKRSQDYTIGPEDLLEVSIFEWELREETKTATFRVSETGNVSLPVIGALSVGGETVGAVKAIIEKRLRDGGFIQQPRVSVDVREYRSKKVAVVGAVKDPGVYTLRQNVTTLLDIVSLAGGLGDNAGYIAYVLRPGVAPAEGAAVNEPLPIDLYELLEQGDLSLNMVLRGGDVINVAEAQTYSVIGYVRKPGNFPLKRPTTLLEGVAEAGGLLEQTASTAGLTLKRRLKTGGTVVFPLDLMEIVRGEKPNWYLQPGDVLDVPEDTGRRFTKELIGFIGNVFSVGYTLNK